MFLSAPDDYTALAMDIIFTPAGPSVECVNISINEDFLVEDPEVFSFFISPNQLDEAVQVGPSFVSFVTILDDGGTCYSAFL